MLRSRSVNEFEKDFFKLAVNSVYGKTMEDVRGRLDCHFVRDRAELIKRTSMPSFDMVMEIGSLAGGVWEPSGG